LPNVMRKVIAHALGTPIDLTIQRERRAS
jgi:hypothetical protein